MIYSDINFIQLDKQELISEKTIQTELLIVELSFNFKTEIL